MEIEIRSKGLTGSGPSQRGCDLCARTGPPVFRGLQIYTQHYYYPSNLFGLWKKSDLFGLWDAWPGVSQPGAALEQLRLMPSSSDRSLKKKSSDQFPRNQKKKAVINRVIETSEETRRLFVWQVRVPPIVLPFLAQVQESPVEQFCSNFQRCRSFSGFKRVGGMAGQQLARTWITWKARKLHANVSISIFLSVVASITSDPVQGRAGKI